MMLAAFPLHAAAAQAKIDWTPLLSEALEQAAAEQRVIFVTLGFVGDERSDAIRKSAFGDKGLAEQTEATLNVPAWSYRLQDERRLPPFGAAKALDHHENLVACLGRWLKVNDQEAIALPQHLWLSPQGELLLSCPWEMSAQELSWCFDEAFRRAEVPDPPPLIKGAHPPRRLLLGEVFELPAGETYGRGLLDDELEETIARLNKGFYSTDGAADYAHILFTDSKEAMEFIHREIGAWELGGSRTSPIVVGTIGTIGNLGTPIYFDLLEKYWERPSDDLRAQVAVAYEQIGSSEGASIVKKGLKNEKSAEVRPEWARALGACGRGDKAVAKTLIKLVDKDKNSRVRVNAILALGHVLPEKSAYSFLTTQLRGQAGEEQRAAALALGLGRAIEARPLLEELRADDPGEIFAGTLDAVLRVLNGANLYELEPLFRELDGSDLERKRLFFRGTLDLPGADDEEGKDEGEDG